MAYDQGKQQQQTVKPKKHRNGYSLKIFFC